MLPVLFSCCQRLSVAVSFSRDRRYLFILSNNTQQIWNSIFAPYYTTLIVYVKVDLAVFALRPTSYTPYRDKYHFPHHIIDNLYDDGFRFVYRHKIIGKKNYYLTYIKSFLLLSLHRHFNRVAKKWCVCCVCEHNIFLLIKYIKFCLTFVLFLYLSNNVCVCASLSLHIMKILLCVRIAPLGRIIKRKRAFNPGKKFNCILYFLHAGIYKYILLTWKNTEMW